MIIKAPNTDDLDEVISMLDLFFPSSKISKEELKAMLTKNVECEIICNENIAGFVLYGKVCNEAEIYYIGIKEEYRRKNFASLLLEYIKKTCNKIYLEVRKSNLSAINLYKKNGFIETYERKQYYSNGENALVFVYDEVK